MRHTTNRPPTSRRSPATPTPLRKHSKNLAVPSSLRPLADALEANSVLVDRDSVISEMDSLSSAAVTDDVRLRDIVDLFDHSEGGQRTVSCLGVSSRSHALLDMGAGGVWRVQDPFLRARPGTALVSVYGQASTFRMLAHLSDDLNLTMAARSSDLYAWLAESAAVPRRLAKDALVRVLLGQRDPRVLLEAAHDLAGELTESPEEAVEKTVAALEQHFGAACAYLADRAQYESSPGLAVQAATNRVSNAALVHAHMAITEKNLGVPVVLGGPSEVIYEVPNDCLDGVELRFHHMGVAREGIRMQVRADVMHRG